jgi:hypothetical protein
MVMIGVVAVAVPLMVSSLVGDVGLACIWVVFNRPLGWPCLTPTPA